MTIADTQSTTTAHRPAALPAPTRSISVHTRAVAVVLAGYALARLVTVSLLAVGHVLARTGWWPWTNYDASRSFGGFLQWWDGHAYQVIATTGYPSTLPRTTDGLVQQNEWAFLPGYPAVTRWVMDWTGLDFPAAGALVSIIAGAAAVVALYAVVVHQFGVDRAVRAGMLFACNPLAIVFHVTYAETLFLALSFTALALLVRGRWLTLVPLAVAAAAVRPGALFIPAALGAVFVDAVLRRRRMPWTRWVALVGAGLVTAAAGLAWPVVVSAVTGTPDAYVLTELAWWRDIIGVVEFVPLTPSFLLGWSLGGVLGVAVVAVALGTVTVVAVRRSRGAALPLRAAVLSYGLYVVAVFLPQQSLFRLLLPAAPALGSSTFTGTRRRFVVTCGVFVALQPVAIVFLWLTWPL
ncbi:hypothetical protein [Curtobacterium sp. VKM Ac-2922]|uniref:hypothetical protein n=1 Tax=Curtobacterium sp. VKM Ac-2922 TaxID=2929475 RepID=UPI001FB42020|nr:hypothetical protein [Curtobacterium sp. VKM Ac-2922]MCJ1715028.1 hypothetical protein [Curtobacterium sp. VKM Ac-2922]